MAECGKKDTCKNYDKKCSQCWANSSIYDTHPCYASKDLVEVVRCKDCKYYRVGNPNADYCYHERYEGLSQSASYKPDDFCSYGTPKERVKDKPKITCLNCKHLMFSDMYGECNKQLRIVNPSDTCEFAEPKERGGEK